MKVSHGATKVSHVARKVSHGARKVSLVEVKKTANADFFLSCWTNRFQTLRQNKAN